MITRKILNLKSIYQFTGHHIIWLGCWMSAVTWSFQSGLIRCLALPWVPLSLIGTAVAFYVGFKNSQSYDRLWEARKVWGALVNHSRMFATTLKNFRSSHGEVAKEIVETKKRMIYRHIAFVYLLREQLLVPTPWEHVSLSWRAGSYNRKRRADILEAGYSEGQQDNKVDAYLDSEEAREIRSANNPAVQLVDKQSRDIAVLYSQGALDMMQQVELQKIINSFYEEQGKAERIKKFPFPRQYASFSFVFVCIFVFLLPFGLVSEFSKIGEQAIWLTIPIGCVIGWVYVVMELIGDYSENPFEGLFNDVPMLSICRTVEIDLLQIIGNQDIPDPIAAHDGILM